MALSAFCVLACGGATEGLPRRASSSGTSPSPRAKLASGRLPLTAHAFAEVSDVIGPYVGSDGQLALAVWAEAQTGASSARRLFAVPLSVRGEPGQPLPIGISQANLDLVLVRGFGAAGSSQPGSPRFALITTRRHGQKARIDVTALTQEGKASWGPTTVAERAGRVLWVGFVASAGAPLLVWAEQAEAARAGEPAALYGQVLEPNRVVDAVPVLIAAQACAWQVASVGSRAALASVRPVAAVCGKGPVVLDLLGETGKSERTVELGGQAALDLDVVGSSAGFVLAWSDHSELEPLAVTAVVAASGEFSSAAAPAAPALGEQAVVALVPGSSVAASSFLVWENLTERPTGARFFQVSALDEKGRTTGVHSRLLHARTDGSMPELVAFKGGVAALTLAPMCGLDEDCAGGLAVPTFVAFDASLTVISSEPLVLPALGGRAAELGWGLTCGAGCFALAAPSRSPSRLFAVQLPVRQSLYHAAAERESPGGRPRVTSSHVLARTGEPLAHVVADAYAGHGVVGYVTDFDPTTPWQKLSKPAADGRLEPLRAKVALRAFSTEGTQPLAEEQVVSLRAHSLGGLTLVPAGPLGKEALALWTGLDQGEPQVFLTLVDGVGKRSQQRMLTRKPGDASDVAGLFLDSGYLVAWVDGRSGDPEIYAARISRTLERASPEQRVTTTDGAAAEVTFARVAGRPYLVWADARAAEQPGRADLFGAFLRPNDAARDGAERRLTSTLSHSFSPRLSELSGAPVLAWLEEASEASPPSVRLARLSADGELSGKVSVVPIEQGSPLGLGLECGPSACRVAVSVDADGGGEIRGFEWRPEATAPEARRIAGLGAPSNVSPVVRGNFVYVADLRDGRGLLRRLGVEW